jgi:hypothetical protein
MQSEHRDDRASSPASNLSSETGYPQLSHDFPQTFQGKTRFSNNYFLSHQFQVITKYELFLIDEVTLRERRNNSERGGEGCERKALLPIMQEDQCVPELGSMN